MMVIFFGLLSLLTLAKAIPISESDSSLIKYAENPVVKKYQQYLQIDTSRPENIQHAVEFWRRQAQAVGLTFKVYEPAGKPICVLTLEGANSSLPSIMLNSHMDVVPVESEDWLYPPFSGHIDENGDIYSRGAQDTKDVSIQYLEAVSAIRRNNVTLQRSLHITLMPDEETGGFHGIKAWIKSQEFKNLNIGFALDEGFSSPTDTILATYVDKRPWQMEFILLGKGGHAATIPDDSAMEKVTRLIDSVMAFRDTQKVLKSHNDLDFGSYTTLNVNILQGGIATNVIPTHIKVVVDMRLATTANVTEMEMMVASWIKETGGNTTLKFIRRDDLSIPTPVDDSNPYWVAITETMRDMNITIRPIIRPATSDMLVLRAYGIPAIGFAPKTRTESRIHGANEYLNAATLLRGIDIYVNLLQKKIYRTEPSPQNVAEEIIIVTVSQDLEQMRGKLEEKTAEYRKVPLELRPRIPRMSLSIKVRDVVGAINQVLPPFLEERTVIWDTGTVLFGAAMAVCWIVSIRMPGTWSTTTKSD